MMANLQRQTTIVHDAGPSSGARELRTAIASDRRKLHSEVLASMTGQP